MFRKLDLVASTCPGTRVVGVYFGTGDVQRPSAQDGLRDPSLNNGRDVVGVLWDTPSLPSALTIDDLEDMTTVSTKDARLMAASGKRGWYMRLDDDESMLRDPLVFEGTAYFKTFKPTRFAAECTRTTGVDAVYAVNNCSAQAVVDADGDRSYSASERKAWTGSTDVGGNLLVVTPKRGAPIVSHANLTRQDKAQLKKSRNVNVPRIYMWREPGKSGR